MRVRRPGRHRRKKPRSTATRGPSGIPSDPMARMLQHSLEQMRIANRIYAAIGASVRLTEADLGISARFKMFTDDIIGFGAIFTEYLYGSDRIIPSNKASREMLLRGPHCSLFRQAIEQPTIDPEILNAMQEQLIVSQEMQIDTGWACPGMRNELTQYFKDQRRPINILEIGAGIEGTHYFTEVKVPQQHRVILLDQHEFITKLLLSMKNRMGSKAFGNIKIVQANFVDYRAPHHPFDLQIVAMVVRYIPREDRPAFFRKARAIAPDGGKLIVMDGSLDISEKDIAENIAEVATANGFTLLKREDLRGKKNVPYFQYTFLAA